MREPAWVQAGAVAGSLGFTGALVGFFLCLDDMLSGLLVLVVVVVALSRYLAPREGVAITGYLGLAVTLLVFLLCRDEMLGLLWLVVVPLAAYMALSRKPG